MIEHPLPSIAKYRVSNFGVFMKAQLILAVALVGSFVYANPPSTQPPDRDAANKTILDMNYRPSGDIPEKLKQKLSSTMPETHWHAVALADAMMFMHDISGLDIVVDWDELESVGVSKASPVTVDLRNLSFQSALSEVLNSTGKQIGFAVSDGKVLVTRAASNAKDAVDAYWIAWGKDNPDIPVDTAKQMYADEISKMTKKYPSSSRDYVQGRADEAWERRIESLHKK